MLKVHKFGFMRCKKCHHKAELFGNLDNGIFRYYCIFCNDIFFSNKFYRKSLVK